MEIEQLKNEVKEVIIDSLNLEDLTPADIDSDAPLFGEGLGLDSIDALELGIAVKNHFKIQLTEPTDDIKQHFASVTKLAGFIKQQQEK